VSLTDVRLTTRDKDGIREAVEAASSKMGVSWKRISLFGSRVDPSAKGGDIDLYVEIDAPPGADLGIFSRKLRMEIQDRLGERKIDLLVDDGRTDLGAFGEIVKQTKVDLWTTG
jgi:predicted nucleotidyltransferase